MFKGDIFITDDFQLASSLQYNPSYLVIGLLDNPKSIFGDETMVRSIPYLLPPYIANEAENLGDMNSFYALYYQHLASPEADSYCALLMAGMYKGFNILFYVNPDEYDLTFVQAFLKYWQDNFGITIGNKQGVPCCFNIAYEDILRIKMYKYHYIPVSEVVMNIHNKITDPMICHEMAQEIGLEETEDPVSQIDKYIHDIRTRPQRESVPVPWFIRSDFYDSSI